MTSGKAFWVESAVAVPALALIAVLLLLAGCGGQTGTGNQTALPGEPVTPLTAGPTLSASQQFQQYEKSHFGFFRPAASYPYVSELGVHWQRPHPGPFVWGSIERSPGAYDWSQTDLYVKESQDANVLITATIWPYADWDQQQCHEKLPGAPFRFLPTLGDYRGKPCDKAAYDKFVTALVERYDGDGMEDMPGLTLPIKYWEIDNEPESGSGTPFFKGDPQSTDYLELLAETSRAVSTADIDARVLNGGIASPFDDPGQAFWKSVLPDGVKFIDVLTIHAVPAPDDLHLPALAALTNELDINLPVWVTEIMLAQGRGAQNPQQEPPAGTASTGAGTTTAPNTTNSQNINSEAEQERWSATLVRDYVMAFGRGADKLFYLGLDNATPAAPAALLVDCSVVVGGELQEDHLQLSGCQRQEAFYAFRTMVDKIDYFDTVQQLADGQYRFTVGARTVYVLWSGQPVPEELAGRVRATDLFGAAQEMDASQITLSDAPQYIEKI